MKPTTPSPAENAQRFAVWRAAMSREWDCTAEEIADVVKLTPKQVRSICRKRKWILLADRRNTPALSQQDVRALLT
jgi:hypothetical protein